MLPNKESEKHRHKQRQQSSLIHEGTYGCGIKPLMSCKKSKIPKNSEESRKYVGKIMLRKHSNPELSMGALVKGIPNWEKYFVVPDDDKCDETNFKTHRDEYEKICKVFQKSLDSDLTQLIAPYAGVSIRRLNITSDFDFIGSLKHMLEAVSILNKQGICHSDLHDGNILVDINDTFRIIDFGSAFVGDTLTETEIKKHIYSFSPEFPPQPPEFAMQNGIYEGFTILHTLESTIAQKRIFKQAQRLIGLSAEVQRHNLIEFWKNDTTWKGGSWIPFFNAYWRVWDSWSIGILFLEILQKCFLLPGFLQTTWITHNMLIKTVLKGLLASSPVKRLTAEDALKLI